MVKVYTIDLKFSDTVIAISLLQMFFLDLKAVVHGTNQCCFLGYVGGWKNCEDRGHLNC